MKKEGIVEEVGSSRVLSFTVAHEKSGEYICEAQNPHGAVNSTILQINAPGQSVLDFTVYSFDNCTFSLKNVKTVSKNQPKRLRKKILHMLRH